MPSAPNGYVEYLVRGEVVARSRSPHIGHGKPQIARPRSITIEFRTASSSSGALYRTRLYAPAPQHR